MANKQNSEKKGIIAIIIPVYNAEDYITGCLESIISQTYPYWRAYCVNDGSKDGSLDILKKYASLDKRITILSKENGGAAKARNYALDKLKDEEWVSFVDADDYIAPSMYATILNTITKDCDYIRLFNHRTTLRYSQQVWGDNSTDKAIAKLVNRDDYFNHEAVGGFISSIFVKKSIIDSFHVRFHENMRIFEDQLFSITCASYSKNILIIQEPKDYYYYDNCKSVTRQTKNLSDDIVRCINGVYDVICSSDDILDNFFYKKYLPAKLEEYYSNKLKNKIVNQTELLNSQINISRSKLSLKTIVLRTAILFLGLK